MLQINLHNLRLGLATNSSSSHSLIFIKDYDFYEYDETPETPISGEFGWDFFTLAATGDKRHYLGIILENALSTLPREMRKIMLRELIGLSPSDSVSAYDDAYIDHQSMFGIPRDAEHPDHIDVEFWKTLRDFVLQPGVVILGGNDNTSEQHPLVHHKNASHSFDFPSLAWGARVRHDPDGDYWVFFNSGSGAKMRFSFGGMIEGKDIIDPEKAYAPELVDIKITDFCPFGCKFCYMGSTNDGNHADYAYLRYLLDVLAEYKVFEVAIGGGEPTLHPRFVDILEYARNKGIVPNFTTRNTKWLEDDDLRTEILEYAGAFAYSVSSAPEVDALAELLKKHDVYVGKANLHVVMGTVSISEFRDILMEANKHRLRVTLLGYKTTGRGNDFEMIPYPWWLEQVQMLRKEYECPSLSIDTVLADEYEDAIKEAGIPSWMFHTEDGKFSAYVDAVAQKMGPASYIEDGQTPLPLVGPYERDHHKNGKIFKHIWDQF